MSSTSHGIQVVERERVEAPTVSGSSAERIPPSAADDGVRFPRSTLVLLGLVTLIVGAWGGIVPFVGPIFGFDADGSVSWYWNLPHALLWLAPGTAACVAAAMMFGALRPARTSLGQGGAYVAGGLAVLCGAWFVVGPEAWPVLVHSAGVFTPAGAMRSFVHEIGYSFGPGVLLVLLGALAMGRGRIRPRAVRAPRPARQPVVTATPVWPAARSGRTIGQHDPAARSGRTIGRLVGARDRRPEPAPMTGALIRHRGPSTGRPRAS